MKLVISSTSPYARKVRVLIIEKGLRDEVEIVAANPLDPNAQDIIRNPLGKVPTLILPDESVIFDSPVICAYLDAEFDGPTIVPIEGAQRWTSDRAQALGDGILDAAFNIVMERKRTDSEPSAFWTERWSNTIQRGLDAMVADVETISEPLCIGSIACAVALGYLDFRLPEIGWRAAHPALIPFFDIHHQRPSFTETVPPG